ncbi:MAG: hypothetical protein P4L65_05095 [Legionella sp.]|nr:hypothetical protein [Legionella sp.]
MKQSVFIRFFLWLGFISFVNLAHANTGLPIFDIKAKELFPGTGQTTAAVVNSGEQLTGTYTITLSAKWSSPVRVTPTRLPQGMSMDTTTGCGNNSVLRPGQQCLLTLKYTVPGVTKTTLVNQGPIVCTSAQLIHCSQPNDQNRLNMSIEFKPTPTMLLKGLQSLLLGNSTGNLNQWFKINQAEDYNSIAYGNGRWILAGSVNANNKTNILTSTDGTKWTALTVSGSDTLFNVYYAESINEWLLSGVNGVLFHSTDGINFTRIKLPTGNTILSTYYAPASGPNLGHWIVMTGDTTNYGGGEVFTSTNGTVWEEKVSVVSPYTFVSMSTNPQGNTVVLSRKNNWWEDAKVATTTDGVTWVLTDFNYPVNQQYRFFSVVWNPINSNWVVVGAHWYFNGTWTYGSLGLITTTPAVPGSYAQIAQLSNNNLNPNITSLLIVTNGSKLVVTNDDGSIFYSSDGVNWTKYLIGNGFSLSNPTFGTTNGVQSLSLLNQGNELYKANLSNLSSWQKVSDFPAQRQQNTLLYASGNPAWFSVGNDNSILNSGNGLNWSVISQRDRSNTIPSTGIVLRGFNQWLILAQDVSRFTGVSYSKDGIVWSRATLPSLVQTGDQLWDADYSTSEQKYLLIGTRNTTPSAMLLLSSVDGKTWIPKNSDLTNQYLRAILWNSTLNQWVAAGNGALVSSTDGGTHWVAAQGDPVTNTGLRDVAWSNTLHQYLVVGNRSGQEVIYRSTDGLNWSMHLFSETGYLRSAAYSPSKALWVVVGYGGVILTSSDGVTWTRESWLPKQSDWDLWTVEWNDSLKLWIAAGGSSVSQYGGNILIYSADGHSWKISTDKQLFLTSSLAIKQ